MKTPRDEVCAMQEGRFLRPFDSPGFFALFAAFNNFKARERKGFAKRFVSFRFGMLQRKIFRGNGKFG